MAAHSSADGYEPIRTLLLPQPNPSLQIPSPPSGPAGLPRAAADASVGRARRKGRVGTDGRGPAAALSQGQMAA